MACFHELKLVTFHCAFHAFLERFVKNKLNCTECCFTQRTVSGSGGPCSADGWSLKDYW